MRESIHFCSGVPSVTGCVIEDEKFAVDPCSYLCHTEAIIPKGKGVRCQWIRPLLSHQECADWLCTNSFLRTGDLGSKTGPTRPIEGGSTGMAGSWLCTKILALVYLIASEMKINFACRTFGSERCPVEWQGGKGGSP